MSKGLTISAPRKSGNLTNEALRRALRKLGILWPGDEYAHGSEVYLSGTGQVIKLVAKLDQPNSYTTECGGTYIERKTATGYTQELHRPRGARADQATPPTHLQMVRQLVASYLIKRGEPPSVLHISAADLQCLFNEEPNIAETGDLGMDISLVARGQMMSVDRRITS